jgi:ribosome-binding protein aMBF1 (putative translation factor)
MDQTQEKAKARIRRSRQLFGLSQYVLANRAGVGRTRLSLFENGHIKLRDEEIQRLEKVLSDALHERKSDLDLAVDEECR